MLALASVFLLAAPLPAFALDHQNRIREVFAGTTGRPDAEFIELQSFQSNQDQVEGNILHVYNAAGAEVRTYTFPNPAGADPGLPNEASQAYILIGTGDAASFFGVTPDLVVPAGIPAAGGQVCYEDVDNITVGIIDCASWGSYSGPSGDPFFSGTPFNAAGGIVDGQSMRRDISGGASPTLLDATDDTNDSAADFDLANPANPINNAGNVTSTAGSAEVSGGVLSFAAHGGVANRLEVARAGSNYTLTDSAAPVTPGAGCQRTKTNKLLCAVAGVNSIDVDLGDLDDRATVQNGVDASVDAGLGKDRLTSRDGNTVLMGGEGNDTFDPGTGTDVMIGGPGGADTASYASRDASAPVIVDIDGVADDGNVDDEDAGGLRDNVGTDIERLVGGAGADDLTGSSAANRLTGGPGQDTLTGLQGNDEIFAKDSTSDTISCGAGMKDHVFPDLVDVFPTSGPDACELVN